MKGFDRSCPFCRFMRSLAFTGVGMGLGSGIAYLLGASKENIMMSGIVVAAVLVFGLLDRKKKN
ncbi:hypothetical protein Q9L42_015575 [Methylomarinum sp. Ch1-1]|uniref:DUF2752 domain-containing protein n=1 Tax=Methylomarinum roseum TaxID=3067653 RepID=A0AAU7NS14_9GAMM|nr:hypothetical protein [Methylomarinum sp. Ch1-1]MDP4520244.1 hypothetical protein [Methylomarinum sp. Ch1-1]